MSDDSLNALAAQLIDGPATPEPVATSRPAKVTALTRFDCVAAGRFLTALDRGDSFTFQTFDDNEQRKSRLLARTLHGRLSDLASQLETLNRQGAGVFVTVNEVRTSAPRTADNITRVRALFVDLDDAPIEPVLNWKLRPHIVVESSPGKFHAYWRVDGVPLEQCVALLKKLAALFGGDPKVCDLPRVLRLPGSWHQKINSEGVRAAPPFKTVVKQVSGQSPDYSFTDFETALADVELPSADRKADRRTPEIKAKTPRDRVNEAALAMLQHWAEDAFPGGKWQATGAYRLSSEVVECCRHCQGPCNVGCGCFFREEPHIPFLGFLRVTRAR